MALLITLSVDVGLDGLGIALFRGGELMQAWYQRPAVARAGERGPLVWSRLSSSLEWLKETKETRPDRVVVETMRVYPGRSGYGKDPADLIQLSGIVGAVADRFDYAEIAGIDAPDWKGQVPKAIMLERIKFWISKRGWSDRVLTPSPSPALVHNAIDAAGLGMVALGLEGALKKRPFKVAY